MRVLVVSSNRLAGLGLVTLAESSGVSAAIAPLEEALSAGRRSDLTLLYCDAWDDGAQDAARSLHAAHVRFIAVAVGLDPAVRRQILETGALHAFRHDETPELAAVLANFRWSAQPSDDQFTLANGYTVDLARRRVQRGDRYLDLTLTECEILSLLREAAQTRPHRPVPLRDMNLAVWGSADARSSATLRGHVSQLRSKIEVEPSKPAILLGRRGQGYWIELHMDVPRGIYDGEAGA